MNPSEKMSKCLYWKLKCITETILLFYSLPNISDQSNEAEVPFSRYIYYKPGVQFEHFSNVRVHFKHYPSLPKLAEMLLQCYLKIYTSEEMMITWKYNTNRPHLSPSFHSLCIFFFSFFLPLPKSSFCF